MSKRIIGFSVLVLIIGFLGCKKDESSQGIANISFMVGDAIIKEDGKERNLKVGDILSVGDVIETGKNSVVIVSIENKTAEVEIQENAVFTFDSYDKIKKIVSVQKGNVWFRLNRKLIKDDKFLLKTPTAVAAVRGTKMYAFQMGDVSGMCHCEGDVEFTGNGTRYHSLHHRDELVVTKGNKTVLLTAEDLSFFITSGEDHKHSLLDNSPLGEKKIEMTPEIQGKFMAVIEKKLNELQ